MSDDASSDFKYGEDEYDLPNPRFSNESVIDLYVKDSDFYLYRDIKLNDFSEKEYQAWAISSESYDIDQFELNWNMSELDREVHLVINGDAIDMKNQETLIVNNLDDAFIVVGSVMTFLDPVPDQFNLSNAYPNPFNPTTTLNLDLNEDGFVSVNVYNVAGQLVSNLVSADMSAGYHAISWDAGSVASGMYIVKVITDSNVASQKVMLLK